MQICGAGPYDQHLMLGEHELTDHSQSLASLGVFPGALLTLKVSFFLLFEIRMSEKKYTHGHENLEKALEIHNSFFFFGADVSGPILIVVTTMFTFVPPEQRTVTNRCNLDLRSSHCFP